MKLKSTIFIVAMMVFGFGIYRIVFPPLVTTIKSKVAGDAELQKKSEEKKEKYKITWKPSEKMGQSSKPEKDQLLEKNKPIAEQIEKFEETLKNIPLQNQTARSYILLKLGESVVGLQDPELAHKVFSLLDVEISRPEFQRLDVGSDFSFDPHHQPELHQRPDGIYVSTLESKLAAIRTLQWMGSRESLERLMDFASNEKHEPILRKASIKMLQELVEKKVP